MSKWKKLIIGLIAIVIVSGGAILVLKQKSNDVFVQREISIEQAEVEQVTTETYRDEAGFRFDHPASLIVNEVELDDADVYSSIELEGEFDEKISIRIADTKTENLEEWQTEFEEKNVVIEIDEIFLADIDGLQVVYGAPKKLLTVAVDGGVLYTISSPADEGYWDKIHEQILNSFEFDESVYVSEDDLKESQVQEVESDIVLIEEILE